MNSALAGSWIKSNLDAMELYLELGTATGVYTDQFYIGTFDTDIDECISYEIMGLQDSTQYFCRWKAAMSNEEFTSEESSFITKAVSTGLAQISETSNFKVFPNPTSSILKIEPRTDLGFYSYHLRDISGKMILSGKVKGILTLDVSNLQSGIYILNIQGDTIDYNQKLIKN